MTVLETVRSRLVEIESRMSAINDSTEKEGRLLTPEEKTELVSLQGEHKDLKNDLALREGVLAAKAATSEPQPVTKRPAFSITQPGGPYKNFGSFLEDVKTAGTKGNRSPDRLVNAVSTYGSEGTSADGGYAVPNDLRRDIQSYVLGSNSLLGLTDKIPTFSNTLVFPLDEVQPWSTQYSGTWLAEAGAYAEAKPNLGTFSVSVGKIGTIVNVTEELMADAVAMGAFVSRKIGERLNYLTNTAIISGSGANNSPNGFLLSSAKKVIAKETGQVAASVVNQNILKMYYGMAAEDRGGGVWLISDSAEYALATTTFSGSTILSRPGDVGNASPNTILGRPVYVMKQLPAVGAESDICFVNLSQYLAVIKGDVATSVTPYLYWNQDVQSFKAVLRIGGKTWRSTATTLPDSTTRSPFVVLGAR